MTQVVFFWFDQESDFANLVVDPMGLSALGCHASTVQASFKPVHCERPSYQSLTLSVVGCCLLTG